MTRTLSLPMDSVVGQPTDFDLATDFLELSAFFADTDTVPTSGLVNEIELGTAEDPADVDEEMYTGAEEIQTGTVKRIESRQRILKSAYPYELDSSGDMLTCALDNPSMGQAAYILSLVLSNLQTISPVLTTSELHPDEADVSKLREYFQYFATAALAAEIGGVSWSFGFPRPDHSSFLAKLTEIWRVIQDGHVSSQVGAPAHPKDDQVDVFAARPHPDRLPGFLLAAAQVATGNNWKAKSLRGHLSAFKSRWFGSQPVTDFLTYMIIPFARPDEELIDDVRTMGNVLHRLRVPGKVEEAGKLLEAGVSIEAYDLLEGAMHWGGLQE